MNFKAFLLYGMVLVVAMASASLTACDKNRAPPTPVVGAMDLRPSDGSPSSPTSSTDTVAVTPKQPYGAAAPMAPGSDGAKPLLSAGVDQPPLNTAPETIVTTQPTGAGVVTSSAASAPSVPLSATEIAFITQAIEAGLFDMRAAQLATERSTSSAVKSYAALVMADQTTLNANLQQLASRLGLPRPTSLSEPRQKILDELARTAPADFDRAFMAAAGAMDHRTTVELFEQTGRDTRDPQVRSFVLAALPTLRAHQNAAERLPL